MNMRWTFLIVFALALFAAPAFAVDFEMDVDHPTDILAGTSDTMTLELTNTGGAGWFTVSIFSTKDISDWFDKKDMTIKLESGETRVIDFTLSPPLGAKQATYVYSLIIMRNTGGRLEENLITTIRQQTYSAEISEMDLTCTRCVDDVGVTLVVENVGTSLMEDLQGLVEIDGVKKTLLFGDISPGGMFTRRVDFLLQASTPRKYVVDAKLFYKGHEIDAEQRELEITVVRDIEVEREVSTTPIGAFVTIKLSNTGNSLDKAVINDVIADDWWVAYLGPAPDQRVGDGWTWFATLLPQEDGEISYVLFYWPVPILIILFAVGAILSYLHLTGVHIYKVAVKRGEEVNISLRVRNLGGKLEGVVARDLVPSTFKLPKKYLTLKPIMHKTGHGTELIWRLGNLRAGEERVMHYSIIPKEKHHRTLKLPAASVRGKRDEKTMLSVSKPTGYLEVGNKQTLLNVKVE